MRLRLEQIAPAYSGDPNLPDEAWATVPAAAVGELDIEATAENIARHVSAYKDSGRYHEPTYSNAKAVAIIALQCALPTPSEGLTERYRAALSLIRDALSDCELNMANYDEDGVSHLNRRAIDAYLAADEALATPEKDAQ